MTNEIRIMIADDHPIVRQGLRQVLEAAGRLSVVAEAGDGETALQQIRTHRPSVAVLDIDMPLMDGFAVSKAIRTEELPSAIVFLTIHRDEELFQAAMDLGVQGYVLKDCAITDISAAVRAVAAGQPYISPQFSAYLLRRNARRSELVRDKPGLEQLTTMERRVLRLIADDKTTKEIAGELFISPRTVETHRTNISKKLDLRGSLALVRFAVANRSALLG